MNILEISERVLGWERFIKLFYEFVFSWAGRNGMTQFNLGYAPASEAITADRSCQEPFQMELYRQIAGALGPRGLDGRRVLEISCGLGGGFDHLVRHFRIGFGVALDRSFMAVRWARRRFGVRAVQGDARQLPFADGSFEVLVNIEASHNYFSTAFIAEVARVLAPNGLFAMADERLVSPGVEAIEATMKEELARVGLDVIEFRDVTGNVAEACKLDTPRVEAILAKTPWLVRRPIRKWTGSETSPRYRSYLARSSTYFILVAQRR